MARLDDLLPELKIISSEQKESPETKSETTTGKKRRAWLADEININEVNDDNNLKGSIDHVYSQDSLCFSDLRSNPLQLFIFLHEITRREGDNYTTPRVMLREMMLQLDISKDSARTALRFLLKNNFIERIDFQPGQFGWSRYQLNKKVCEEKERDLSTRSIGHIGVAKKVAHKPIIEETIDLWSDIDFSALEVIGFNKNHILQIKNKTTPEIAQESINHFSYSLKHNKKTKEYPNPIATLITVLKRGEAWIEPNYQSPQELAQLKIIESKKAEIERNKALKEEIYSLAFEEWKQSLSEEEKNMLAPDRRNVGDPIPPHAKLSTYFKEEIWPKRKKNYQI